MISPLYLPDEAVPYILFQRTAYLRFTNTQVARLIRKVLPFVSYEKMLGLEAKLGGKMGRPTVAVQYSADMQNEYASIRAYLPAGCSSILDIGCGVAGIDVFLQRHYQAGQPRFFLLDKSQVEANVHYGFRQRGAFYNSLDVAKAVLVGNGVAADKVSVLEATDDYALQVPQPVDLVISLISWGFHYPVETYVKTVHELLAEQGRLILDVRKETDGMACLNDWFSECMVIVDTPKYWRVVCRK